MIPLDGRGVPGLTWFESAQAERVGNAIARRTQTKPFFNTMTGGIFFARGQTPNMGPYELPFKPDGEGVRPIPEHDIDNLVAYINLSLIPQETKDKWEKGHDDRAKHDAKEANEKMFEDRRHDIENYAEFLSRKRRGVGTVVQTL